jgi:ferredoxin
MHSYNPTMAEVAVDPDLCIGSAECVRIAPEAFAIDESRGISVPLPNAPAADRAKLVEAVEACPMRAISVSGQ